MTESEATERTGPYVGQGVYITDTGTPGVVVGVRGEGGEALVEYGNLVMQRLERNWFSREHLRRPHIPL